MKLPRDLSGHRGRAAARPSLRLPRDAEPSSHMTVTLTAGGEQHQVTVPRHRDVRIGTLDVIVTDVAGFLGLPKQAVRDTLFG